MSGLAVYVHIPFCTVKCGYCDFNAYAGLDSLKDAYAAAVCDEIVGWRDVAAGREITSIFFGGGTPGEMEPEAVGAMVAAVRMIGPLAEDAEVTLEANPATLLAERMADFRAAGVTRLSLGVQSFLGDELKFLDRLHSPEAAAACVKAARRARFDSASIDLIYGLPGQTGPEWAQSLRQALALEPDHISCYSLTVEEGTVLAARVERGEVPAPDPDIVAAMYESACEALHLAGYEHYEISNWARRGHRSRHNVCYWTEGDYLGTGAGAHGYLAGTRYENVAHPAAYIQAIGERQRAIAKAYRPNRAMRMGDWLEARLRMLEGFEVADFESAFEASLTGCVGDSLAWMIEAGVLENVDGVLRLAERGLLLHSEVVAEFMVEIARRIGEPVAEAATASWAKEFEGAGSGR